jgi:hypothetical protein
MYLNKKGPVGFPSEPEHALQHIALYHVQAQRNAIAVHNGLFIGAGAYQNADALLKACSIAIGSTYH